MFIEESLQLETLHKYEHFEPLLAKTMIAIKISSGLTERESIKNIIMQGTVFGSLICTTVMDKLAKLFYKDENLLFKYKKVVDIYQC